MCLLFAQVSVPVQVGIVSTSVPAVQFTKSPANVVPIAVVFIIHFKTTVPLVDGPIVAKTGFFVCCLHGLTL